MAAPLLVVVGRVSRAHGVRGDVAVEVRTDEPERRFTPGVRLMVDEGGPETVTVESLRWHSGRLLLHLAGVDDRTAAEALRGRLLQVELDPEEQPADPEEYYHHQLVGLTVVDRDGRTVGTVADVVHGAQDLLVLDRAPDATAGSHRRALIPFVQALVPQVDLAAGRVVVDLPEGLLELSAD